MSADLVVEGRDGTPVLLVEVRPRETSAADLAGLISRLKSGAPAAPYGMLVDPREITLIAGGCEDSASPLLSIPSAEVFRTYDPDYTGVPLPFGSDRVFKFYLAGLVGAWLSDLSSPWKADSPPWADALAGAGLLGRLDGATVVEEALVRDDPLS